MFIALACSLWHGLTGNTEDIDPQTKTKRYTIHQQTYRYLHYAVSNLYFSAPLDLPLLGCSCLLLCANTEGTLVSDTFFKIRNICTIKLLSYWQITLMNFNFTFPRCLCVRYMTFFVFQFRIFFGLKVSHSAPQGIEISRFREKIVLRILQE